MEKELKKLLKFCKENHVEISVRPEGIGLWTTDQKLSLSIEKIHPSMVETAVTNLRGMRVVGWKQA